MSVVQATIVLYNRPDNRLNCLWINWFEVDRKVSKSLPISKWQSRPRRLYYSTLRQARRQAVHSRSHRRFSAARASTRCFHYVVYCTVQYFSLPALATFCFLFRRALGRRIGGARAENGTTLVAKFLSIQNLEGVEANGFLRW